MSDPMQLEDTTPLRFQIKCSTWKGNKADVIDAAASTPSVLYNLETHLRKPHIVVSVPGEPVAFATANMHTLSTKIDMDVRGQSFEMKPTRLRDQKDFIFNSPALDGQVLTWNEVKLSSGIELICSDEQGNQIGRMRICSQSSKMPSELEITASAAGRQDLKEEVVLTGLTVCQLYWLRVAARSGGIASSTAAGAAAAASVSV